MCSSLDKFRFNLPYGGLFGGVVSMETSVYQFINGMSNLVIYILHFLIVYCCFNRLFLFLFWQFYGWGGEDDDLYGRIQAKNLDICRLPPYYSQYTMLKHNAEVPSENRLAFLRNGSLRYNTDGLNSLVYNEKEIKLHKLFTHILAETWIYIYIENSFCFFIC